VPESLVGGQILLDSGNFVPDTFFLFWRHRAKIVNFDVMIFDVLIDVMIFDVLMCCLM
jgi:hypothetical protein